MKLTSIISLIIAVVLVLGGFFLCKYARKNAANDGVIDGYSVDADGNTIVRYPFDGDELTTVSINLSDCRIEMTKGGDSSYVVLENFLTSRYICNVTGKTLTVSNDISLSDYISFDGTGVRFGGVWQTIRAYLVDKGNSERIVRINVAADQQLKQINFKGTGSVARIAGFEDGQDVKLTLNDSTVELSQITATNVIVDTKESTVTWIGTTAETFSVKSFGDKYTYNGVKTNSYTAEMQKSDNVYLNFYAKAVEIETTDIETFKFNVNYLFTDYAARLSTPDGTISVGGIMLEEKTLNTSDGTEHPGSLKIACHKGSIDVNFGSTPIPIPEPEPQEKPES